MRGGSHSVRTQSAEVVVQYTTPARQRDLRIHLGNAVTMIRIGMHGVQHVFEPTNRFLGFTEEGLRYHRSMNESDVYDGPLAMARFGRPVSGAMRDESQWLVSPLAYDPTRPLPTFLRKGEIPMSNVIQTLRAFRRAFCYIFLLENKWLATWPDDYYMRLHLPVIKLS